MSDNNEVKKSLVGGEIIVTRWTRRRAIITILLSLLFIGIFAGGFLVTGDTGQGLKSIGLVGMVFAPLFCSPEKGLLD